MDCMEGMKRFPDKYFELVITDPPYGIESKISIGGGSHTKSTVKFHQLYSEQYKKWDIVPSKDYFEELFRISKNQIIWGGNYFQLPPCRGFIFWDKCLAPDNFSDGEYAWTSFNKPAKKVVVNSVKDIQKCIKNNERFHPTQKPVALYKWVLKNYAKAGDKILDTHAGSASSLVACYQMGFDYLGFEIDADYHAKATERIKRVMAQGRLFEQIEDIKSEQLQLVK